MAEIKKKPLYENSPNLGNSSCLTTTNYFSQTKLGDFISKSIYLNSFRQTKNGKHRVYSIFDSPKRCW